MQRCQDCVSVFGTAPQQHFETADGAWAADVGHESPTSNMTSNHPAYACAPARDSERRAASSPNTWRAADALALLPHYPHLLLLPMHAASAPLWQAHPGGEGTVRHADTMRYHGVTLRKTAVDCTHACYSPFLYEPLWEALGLVLPSPGPE
jgi:hypothetical protein